MTARRAGLLAVSGALALAAAPRAAGAWCATSTQRVSTPGECATGGRPLGWNTPCVGVSRFAAGSLTVSFDDVGREIDAAAARWRSAACPGGGSPWFAMQRIDDTVTPTGYDAHGPNANTVSFNDTWRLDELHHTGTMAVTIVTFDMSSGEILDADVELNEASDTNPNGFHFETGMTDGTSADVATILTHEFGHFQGLAHSGDSAAVMWWTADLGEERRDLTPDDIAGICTTYPPSDPPTDRTCALTPYGGFALTPSSARAVGGCSIATGFGPGVRRGVSALGLAALALGLGALRRRRRGC